MGDHRASIKIEFSMHGVTESADMWINWFPGDDGVDRRVTEFFQRAAYAAMEAYDEKVQEMLRPDMEAIKRLDAEYGRARDTP